MIRFIFMLLFLFVGNHMAFSQGEALEKKKVLEVVNQLFDGMRKGDSTMVSAVFTNTPDLYTIFRNKEGAPIMVRGDLKKFLVAVGTPHDKVWDEPIWDTEIRIDGDMAQVWTKYAFYAGDQFSHCGVDAFHLHKGKEGWKVFHLADTRQRQGCEIPESIEKHRQKK